MYSVGNLNIANGVFLAPMEDVSDQVFRKICKKFGADMVFTEFVSSEALRRDVVKSKIKIEFDEEERPLGIQIFGNNAESLAAAAQIAQQNKPDVIDINWGCPVKKSRLQRWRFRCPQRSRSTDTHDRSRCQSGGFASDS